MPLPGIRVVPAGWSRHHQPTATGGMNARCDITDPHRATPGQWDEGTGENGPGRPYYLARGVACRVQAVQGEQDTEQADQTSTARRYLVQVDDPNLSTLADIEYGHVVTITAAINDPHLIGLDLHVVDVQHGSERFTRDLIAVHNQQDPTT